MEPLTAAIIISAFSLHSLAAACATLALTLLPIPLNLERWYFWTWFLPLIGPAAALCFALPRHRAVEPSTEWQAIAKPQAA